MLAEVFVEYIEWFYLTYSLKHEEAHVLWFAMIGRWLLKPSTHKFLL